MSAITCSYCSALTPAFTPEALNSAANFAAKAALKCAAKAAAKFTLKAAASVALNLKKSALPLGAAALLALALSGCSSSSSSSGNLGHSGSYGTGPGHTRPMPQQGKVDLKGITSVPIRSERTSGRGCNRDYRVLGKYYEVWNGLDSYIEEGTASWYGPGFNGRRTSMGEIYNQKGYTAAHKNLPLPSYLKVTNLKNGKKLVLRVNDRGPFVDSRILDLSEGAARYLGVIGPGTAKVRLEYLNVGSGGRVLNAEGSPSVMGSAPASVSAPSSKNSDSDSFDTVEGFQGKSGWVNSDGWISYDNAKVAPVPSKPASAAAPKPANSAKTGAGAGSAQNGSESSRAAALLAGGSGSGSALSGTYVQFAASSDEAGARDACAMLARRLGINVKVFKDGNVNRVLAGPFSDKEAQQVLKKAKASGAPDSFIKRF